MLEIRLNPFSFSFLSLPLETRLSTIECPVPIVPSLPLPNGEEDRAPVLPTTLSPRELKLGGTPFAGLPVDDLGTEGAGRTEIEPELLDVSAFGEESVVAGTVACRDTAGLGPRRRGGRKYDPTLARFVVCREPASDIMEMRGESLETGVGGMETVSPFTPLIPLRIGKVSVDDSASRGSSEISSGKAL
jgi:hypothetical protein